MNGISFEVSAGECVGLLGPNGAGKTTSFYMVSGLVSADEGTVLLNGLDITREPIYRRSQFGIGYLPQETSTFKKLTVEENIEVAIEVSGVMLRKRSEHLNAGLSKLERIDNLINEFNLRKVAKSPGYALSGGERRRLEIARCLAIEPDFILLDEPFAGIDPISVSDIKEIIKTLLDKEIGVLITDHNVRETLSITDRAYIVVDGQIVAHGNADDVINHELVQKKYLGVEFSL